MHSHDIVSFRVSTHSRLKAAGRCYSGSIGSDYCFNTQPPEGGWLLITQHPRLIDVSTHSRLKAAGIQDKTA